MRSVGSAVLIVLLGGCGAAVRSAASEPQPRPDTSGAGAEVAPHVPEAAPVVEPVDLAARLREQGAPRDASSIPFRGSLAAGAGERLETLLAAGECHDLVLVATPSLGALRVEVHDENGQRIGVASAEDGVLEIPGVCPRWTGPFEVRIEAERGEGEYLLGLFHSRAGATEERHVETPSQDP